MNRKRGSGSRQEQLKSDANGLSSAMDGRSRDDDAEHYGHVNRR